MCYKNVQHHKCHKQHNKSKDIKYLYIYLISRVWCLSKNQTLKAWSFCIWRYSELINWLWLWAAHTVHVTARKFHQMAARHRDKVGSPRSSRAVHCGHAADAHGRGETLVYFYCSSPVLRLSEPEWQLELLLSDKHSQHALLCLFLC